MSEESYQPDQLKISQDMLKRMFPESNVIELDHKISDDQFIAKLSTPCGVLSIGLTQEGPVILEEDQKTGYLLHWVDLAHLSLIALGHLNNEDTPNTPNTTSLH